MAEQPPRIRDRLGQGIKKLQVSRKEAIQQKVKKYVQEYETRPLCKVCDKGRLGRIKVRENTSGCLGILVIVFGICLTCTGWGAIVGIPLILLGILVMFRTKKKLVCDECGAAIDAM